ATGIFFWGMALTFVLLMVAKVVPGAGNWPMYPAGVLAILGTFMFLGAGQAASWLVGIVLIVLGVLVIWRGYRK
ncbi:MAG: hypothetical protein HY835_12950, partial [Anaerolineae bacterium]|nr:hypothetical protein [Anaerolineae bacterium]